MYLQDDFSELARCLMLGRGNLEDTRREAGGASARVRAILAKADPGSVGGIGSPSWGGELSDYALVAESFISSLRNVGVFDRVAADAVQLPMKSRVAVAASATTGDGVSEAEPKIVTQLELANGQLDVMKCAATVVVTAELLRLGGENAMRLMMNELRSATVAATDSQFIFGLDAMTSSAIASTGDVLADLRAMMLAVKSGSASRFFLVVTPDDAKVVATLSGTHGGTAFSSMTPQGGVIAGVNVMTSDHVAPGAALFLDAAQLAVSVGTVALSASTQATVTMSETDLTSLWQRNMTGLRGERFFSFEPLRATATAALTGVDWSPGSPA